MELSGSLQLSNKRNVSDNTALDQVKRARPSINAERASYIASLSEPERLIANLRNDTDTKLICLDIDQCSIVGEDTNDILRIIGDKSAAQHDTPESRRLVEVAECLVNPHMKHAVNKLRRNDPRTYIVFYTSKAGIV